MVEPLVILCPDCHRIHLDEGEWATRPHRTHLCLHCGHTWRPREHATVGIPAGQLSLSWLQQVLDVHGKEVAVQVLQAWVGRERQGIPLIDREWPKPMRLSAAHDVDLEAFLRGRRAPATTWGGR